MLIKNIGILFHNKLNKTEIINLNLPLLKKYFKVKLFYLENYQKKKIKNLYNAVADNKLVRYIKIKDLPELIKKTKKVDIIYDYSQILITNKKNYEFLSIFKKLRIKYLVKLDKATVFFWDLTFLQKNKFLIKLIYFIIKYNKLLYIYIFLKNFLKIIFNKIYSSVRLKSKKKIVNNIYNNIDYVFIGSDFDYSKPKFNINNSIKIYTHHKDYERCKFVKGEISIKNNNYSVHLDAAFITHPDRFELKEKHIPNYRDLVDRYYIKLNKFYDEYEKKTGKQIIIAAHPKTKLYTSKFFNNKKFLINKTYELIKDCACVFNHQSSSSSYAVILNKPIITIICEEFLELDLLDQSLANAIALGSKVVPLESYNKLNFHSLFDQKKYNYLYSNFRQNYLKSSKSKEESIWKSLNDKI